MRAERSATTEILLAAYPEDVFAIVLDVGSWGRFSPECSGSDVHPETPLAVGSTFVGHNHRGARRWRTRCTVTHLDPHRVFQFDSAALGMAISTWRYELEETPDGGTRLIHSWIDNRGWLMTRIGILVSGIRDRATHNTASMDLTLGRLKTYLEGPA